MKYLFVFVILMSSSYPKDFLSSEKKVHLIELFSSEGCSSCPQAEKWLNHFKESDLLWTRIIPIELHVTYWDDLNWLGSQWKDPFSQKGFTERQKEYHLIRKKGVYTPQIVIDGEISRNYNLETLDNKKVGVLKASFNEKTNQAKLFFSSIAAKPSFCEGSYIHGGVISNIRGGENKGKRLEHEFISGHIAKAKASKNKSQYTCDLTLKRTFRNKKLKFKKQGVVFWIKDKDHNVVQSVGGYL